MKCKRCAGRGFTFWDAFTASLGNLIGALVAEPNKPFCNRCNGTGATLVTEPQVWKAWK